VTFDIDSRGGDDPPFGSSLDSYLMLFGPDGREQIGCNDDSDGLDSVMTYRFERPGVYYVAVANCCISDGQSGATCPRRVSEDWPPVPAPQGCNPRPPL